MPFATPRLQGTREALSAAVGPAAAAALVNAVAATKGVQKGKGGDISLSVGSGTLAAGGDITLSAGESTTDTGGGIWVSAGHGTATSSGAIAVRTANAGTNGVSGALSFSSGTTSTS